tara:strand:+ start:43160 stop:45163 length:2004 start_codon:yes stop_codon:yes gene_type:complete
MGVSQFWSWMKRDPNKDKTKRKLGYFVILFIIINSILGSSLFYLPNLGVISSGPASIIAWVLIFLIAIFIMMYVAELTVLHPTSGGTYAFCKRTYGRFGSFMAGWLIWIAGNFGMALNLVAAAQYFIPAGSGSTFILQLIFAGVWIIVLNYMAYRSIDAGAIMLFVFGLIAIFVVTLMTLPSFIDFSGLFSGSFSMPFDVNNFHPFFRHSDLALISFLGLTLFLITEAFFGFEVITYMSDEVEDVSKIPKALKTATIISGIIMFFYVLGSIGTVSYTDYVQNLTPFAVQAANTMGQFGQQVVVFGMYLVIIGAAAAWPITGGRLIRAMSEDKLFIKHLSALHPKYKSPYKAVIFQTFVVGLFSWLIFRGEIVGWQDSYRSIYLIYVLISLVVISMILLAVPILRRKEPDVKRIYKAPFGRIGPFVLVFGFILLIINWILLEKGVAFTLMKLAGSFIIVGLPFYFLVEMFYDPKAILRANESLAYVALITEKIFFPFSIRKKILKNMVDVKAKKILEYGCNVGALTKRLAPVVGAKGRIYATDISLKKVKMVSKRVRKFPHVSVHHHPHLDDFKLSLHEKVDGVISVGTLSYMQKPEQLLTSLGKHVKKGGEIIFVDFDKFFYLIPNVKWVENDKKLIDLFSRAGFSVKVTKKRGLLWQYIIVTGVKN